jgi:hypothetical protein
MMQQQKQLFDEPYINPPLFVILIIIVPVNLHGARPVRPCQLSRQLHHPVIPIAAHPHTFHPPYCCDCTRSYSSQCISSKQASCVRLLVESREA